MSDLRIKEAVTLTHSLGKQYNGFFQKFQFTFNSRCSGVLPSRILLDSGYKHRLYFRKGYGYKVINQHGSYNKRIEGAWTNDLYPYYGKPKDLIYDEDEGAWYIEVNDND